ncbi:LCP family protein [Microbacterium sp. G2-8]|uniref:LCP family protein n=1 Tax=Microbacterium sp. G2-8 TaxID=2842454 RepID=UPI001C8A19E7|nr:LCP family protein [Microbacterium sp. G2-8]
MSRTPNHGVRGPIARHTRLRSPGFLAQSLKAIAFVVSAAFVAVVGVGAYAYTDLTSTLQGNAVTLDGQDTAPPEVDVLPNQAVNILLTGVDKCESDLLDDFGGRCTPEMAEAQKDSYSGVLNDVNMVLHISPEPRRVTVISIPRDMMTERPACQDADGEPTYPATAAAFNESYGTGGLPCVVNTAEELTGLDIDHAAMMTWGGVIDITNAIGGVDVCVAEAISDPIHTGLELDAGEHTLEGMTALQFLRVRTGVGDGSDLSRISNQQVYMGSLVRKLVSEETLTDVGALVRLANAVVDNATVSTGLTDPMAMVQIASAASSVPLADYAFIQFPAIDYAPDPNKVAPDEAAWEQVRAALEANQPLDLGTPEPTETPAPTDDVAPTPTPTPTTVPLPSNLSGSNADQATCSNQESALF